MITQDEFLDYKTLSVRKTLFRDVNLNDSFFDSLKRDYEEFEKWFERKAKEEAYTLTGDTGQLLAFLFLKIEGPNEPYLDISPSFCPAKRLKVGTFKVDRRGQRLGERFIKIIFDNALSNDVDEIYATIFERTEEQKLLVAMLCDWGFVKYGKKLTGESVYVRKLVPAVDLKFPKKTFPFVSRLAPAYLTPIYPEYHTELFPDSILKTESPIDFKESSPHRNAIEKIFISRSFERNLNVGDLVFFYRTREKDRSARYSAVVTTVGVVTGVEKHISSEDEFVQLCKNRTALNQEDLKKWWGEKPYCRPFLVKFLHVASFKKRPNRKMLMDLNFPSMNEGPRGFTKLTDTEIRYLISLSELNSKIFVNY